MYSQLGPPWIGNMNLSTDTVGTFWNELEKISEQSRLGKLLRPTAEEADERTKRIFGIKNVPRFVRGFHRVILPTKQEKMIKSLKEAAKNHQHAMITYNGVSRKVEPYSIRKAKTGNMLMYVHEVKRGRKPGGGVKAFKVDSITKASISKSQFEPRQLGGIEKTADPKVWTAHGLHRRMGSFGVPKAEWDNNPEFMAWTSRWHEKLAETTPAGVVTKGDIQNKADSLGVVWDSDKPGSEKFLKYSKAVTGKSHLDDMNQVELAALHQSLEKTAARKEKTKRFYHGSPTPGIAVLEPRKDPRTGQMALFVASDEYSPEIFSLMPKRHEFTKNHTTRKGKFVRGTVIGDMPLNEKGYVYEVEAPVSSIVERKPGRFVLTKPAEVVAIREVTREQVLARGWKVKTAAEIPYSLRKGLKKELGEALKGRKYPEPVKKAFFQGLTKIAEANGHWRKLEPGEIGHTESGQKIEGKTFVHKSRVKSGVIPKAHQADFVRAVANMPSRGGIIAADLSGLSPSRWCSASPQRDACLSLRDGSVKRVPRG